MMALTVIGKLSDENTRGTLLAMNEFVDSLGLVFMNKVGAHMYDDSRKDAPFLITLVLIGVVLVVELVLMTMGKLKV
jgi:hypothetical protein